MSEDEQAVLENVIAETAVENKSGQEADSEPKITIALKHNGTKYAATVSKYMRVEELLDAVGAESVRSIIESYIFRTNEKGQTIKIPEPIVTGWSAKGTLSEQRIYDLFEPDSEKLAAFVRKYS